MFESPPILIVESDAEQSVVIREALGRAGAANQVAVAASAERAIDYLLRKGDGEGRLDYPIPSLIILDLRLEGMPGLDFLKWLRGHAVFRRMPVVVLTHSEDLADIQAAYDAGANSYVVKPKDLEGLKEILKAINGYWVLTAEKPRFDEADSE